MSPCVFYFGQAMQGRWHSCDAAVLGATNVFFFMRLTIIYLCPLIEGLDPALSLEYIHHVIENHVT
jgi:hypothetical protein